MNLIKVMLFTVLGSSMFIASSAANASEAMLKRFFIEVNTLQADFTQQIVDESGMTLENKNGVFSLSRPGKFRWSYANEDPEYPIGQQIVSNGELITFYEPDLETANQRSMLNALEQVPTLLLVQSGESLEEHFNVTDFGLTDGLTWVELKPKDENAGYQGLMIGFAKEQLNSIVLTDGLGNETRLVLSNVVSNSELDSSLFEFTPGDGVDVIRQ
ncbi:MAG: outer membrane lipoprotein chaperone LolA [Arenicella sp.]|nr:outer membrane lipoprotein chaperone LolA [Arenicella sp.]